MLSLALAEKLEWDLLLCRPDDTRYDYFELRMILETAIDRSFAAGDPHAL